MTAGVAVGNAKDLYGHSKGLAPKERAMAAQGFAPGLP